MLSNTLLPIQLVDNSGVANWELDLISTTMWQPQTHKLSNFHKRIILCISYMHIRKQTVIKIVLSTIGNAAQLSKKEFSYMTEPVLWPNMYIQS